jgi:hypothetical protein
MTQIPIYTPEAENLQQIVAAENARLAQEGCGTLFHVQPLPQPGQGCRERVLVQHSYANGVPISATEVAITVGGQLVAGHPKFRWDWDDLDDEREHQRDMRHWRAECEG